MHHGHRAALRRHAATASTSTGLTGGRDHGLRPAGGGQGPDRRAAGRRRAAAVRGRRTWRVHDLDGDRPRDHATATDGERARAGVRRHRRLRRLPRHLPRRRSRAGVLHGLRARAIRSPGSASSPQRRRPREELIYAHHERGFALHSMRSPTLTPALPAVRAGRGSRRAGPTTGSGRSCTRAWRRRRRGRSNEGPILREGHHRHAQLRGRADAVRPAVPGRRRGAYRAADRRQGDEPGDRRRPRAGARAGRLLSRRHGSELLDGYSATVPARGSGGRSASPGG